MTATDWEIFRVQAIKAAGLEGHPKANELYSEAWNRCGWAGQVEVLICLCDLAEIEISEGEIK
jgi:hypothetical protein